MHDRTPGPVAPGVPEALVGEVTEVLQRLLHLVVEALVLALACPDSFHQRSDLGRQLADSSGDLLVLPESEESGCGQVAVPFSGYHGCEVQRDCPGLVELVAVGFDGRGQERPQPG